MQCLLTTTKLSLTPRSGSEISSPPVTSPLVLLTNGASKTCDPPSFESLNNATSLRGSGSGVTPCGAQGGPMTDEFGPVAALVSLSARQAKEAGKLTSGIYGLIGSISSESVALQLSLANRLRVRMALHGSTWFALTWRERDTPQRLPICALRASALPTSDKESFSGRMPTPTATDWKRFPMKESYAFRTVTDGAPDDLAKWAVRTSGIPYARPVPALWRWAMGLPMAWDNCAPTVTQSSVKLRPSSSKRSTNAGLDPSDEVLLGGLA